MILSAKGLVCYDGSYLFSGRSQRHNGQMEDWRGTDGDWQISNAMFHTGPMIKEGVETAHFKELPTSYMRMTEKVVAGH